MAEPVLWYSLSNVHLRTHQGVLSPPTPDSILNHQAVTAALGRHTSKSPTGKLRQLISWLTRGFLWEERGCHLSLCICELHPKTCLKICISTSSQHSKQTHTFSFMVCLKLLAGSVKFNQNWSAPFKITTCDVNELAFTSLDMVIDLESEGCLSKTPLTRQT